MNETYTRRPIYVPAYHLYHDRVDLVKTLPQPSLRTKEGDMFRLGLLYIRLLLSVKVFLYADGDILIHFYLYRGKSQQRSPQRCFIVKVKTPK